MRTTQDSIGENKNRAQVRYKLSTIEHNADQGPKSVVVVNGRGKTYTVSGLGTPLSDPYCNCKGFVYRGECKHIEMAKEQLCQTTSN